MKGKNWYFEVNDYCKTLSEIYNIPLIKVAGIMSALSPNNTFKSNVRSLERFLKNKGNCKVTCFDSQKNKAIKILNTNDNSYDNVLELLGKGLKTRAFFCNIYQPHKSEKVTVDRWAHRWGVERSIVPKGKALTDKRYKAIGVAMIKESKRINVLPHQFQAVKWVELRGKEY
jgi:hypothetical protein